MLWRVSTRGAASLCFLSDGDILETNTPPRNVPTRPRQCPSNRSFYLLCRGLSTAVCVYVVCFGGCRCRCRCRRCRRGWFVSRMRSPVTRFDSRSAQSRDQMNCHCCCCRCCQIVCVLGVCGGVVTDRCTFADHEMARTPYVTSCMSK
jgi:hypothetical protein